MSARSSVVLAAIVLFLGLTQGAALRADPGLDDHCQGLSAEQKAAADQIMAKVYPHDCCDDTLAACLKSQPSRLVKRLASDVCRQVKRGKKAADIQRSMERRAASMTVSGPPADILKGEIDFAGDKEAPVEVIAYVCARCPYCSKIVPGLYECVTDGRTAHKAKLGMRIFPIRGHEHSTEGALAMQASHKLGSFWPYLLQLYAQFDSFTPATLDEVAKAIGLDAATFTAATKDPAEKKKVVASKKEGLRLGVEATPTFFINGRMYTGDVDPEAIVDCILEEYDRETGALCNP